MIVQTLVENAVKHGISGRPSGGSVEIDAFADGPNVVVRVNNSGELQREASTRGIGLANARERLRLLFGDQAHLHLRATEDENVVAELVIPKTACASSGGMEDAASARGRLAAAEARDSRVAQTTPIHGG